MTNAKIYNQYDKNKINDSRTNAQGSSNGHLERLMYETWKNFKPLLNPTYALFGFLIFLFYLVALGRYILRQIVCYISVISTLPSVITFHSIRDQLFLWIMFLINVIKYKYISIILRGMQAFIEIFHIKLSKSSKFFIFIIFKSIYSIR